MKYNHRQYTWTNDFGTVRHDWRMSCVHGGINFHVSITPGYPPSCGLEFHSATPKGDDAPDHLNCPVTGGRCWHDGTSTYAVDSVWQVVRIDLERGDHGAVFKRLEYEVDRYFNRTDEDDVGRTEKIYEPPIAKA